MAQIITGPFYGSKDVRAIEVQLYIIKEIIVKNNWIPLLSRAMILISEMYKML